MKVSREDLTNVLNLSRLSVEKEDIERVLLELESVLTYMEDLEKLDTQNEEPTVYPLPMQNVFREDEVRPSLPQELALSNAPLKDEGYFKMPRVLEE